MMTGAGQDLSVQAALRKIPAKVRTERIRAVLHILNPGKKQRMPFNHDLFHGAGVYISYRCNRQEFTHVILPSSDTIIVSS
jgi:hypothetical protein